MTSLPPIQYHKFSKEVGGLYLPIEALKERDQGFYRGQEVARVFRSSGTSESERSHSYFSTAGLEQYRQSALQYFDEIMGQLFGTDAKKSTPGFSLVPPPSVLPESSLAQMLGWIAEKYELSFGDESDLRQFLATHKDSKVWIFATAAHYVDLASNVGTERGAFKLARGSVVFETGGAKKRVDIPDRKSLYEWIARLFSVETKNIVSEYGMAELACQAYDVAQPGERFEDRLFRFAPHVEWGVINDFGKINDSGLGCLCIYDEKRHDYPFPIRIQDLVTVEMSKQGQRGFRLLGRLPSAAPKGCSLMFESSLPNPGLNKSYSNYLDALAHELGSKNAAQFTYDALCDDAKKFKEQWLNEFDHLKDLFGSASLRGQSWLLVLPGNHSVAAFAPLSLLLSLGANVFVKLPRSNSAVITSIQTLLQYFRNLYADLTKEIAPTFDICRDEVWVNQMFDGCVVYGSDETCALFGEKIKIPLYSFPHKLLWSISSLEEANARATELITDAFSLAQRGCLSSNGLLLISNTPQGGGTDLLNFVQVMQTEFKNFWNASVGIEDRCRREILQAYLHAHPLSANVRVFCDDDAGLMVILLNPMAKSPGFWQLLREISKANFVIPVIHVASQEWTKDLLDLKTGLKEHLGVTGFYLGKQLQVPISTLFVDQAAGEIGTAHRPGLRLFPRRTYPTIDDRAM